MPNKPNTESKHSSADQAVEAFINKMGTQAESALYTIICNRNHPARGNIDKGLAGGADTAMVAIAPHLMSEYKFSLMLATQVAAFAAQQVAIWGQGALCAALTARRTHETVVAQAQPVKEKEPAPAIVMTLDDLPELNAASTKPKATEAVTSLKRKPGRPKGSKNKKKTA